MQSPSRLIRKSGSVVNFCKRIWGAALAKNKIGAFLASQNTFGETITARAVARRGLGGAQHPYSDFSAPVLREALSTPMQHPLSIPSINRDGLMGLKQI